MPQAPASESRRRAAAGPGAAAEDRSAAAAVRERARLDALAVGHQVHARPAATLRPGRCTPPATTWVPAASRPGRRAVSTARASALASMRPGWAHRHSTRSTNGATAQEPLGSFVEVGRVHDKRPCWTRRHRPGLGRGHGPHGTAWERRRAHRPLVPPELGRPALPGPSPGGDTQGWHVHVEGEGGRRWAMRSGPKG